jgi:Flp pilus assembly protein TadB
MDDVSPTNQQIVALRNALEKESQRVSRWLIACVIFAVAVSVLVVVTKSLVFVIVALFSWFFVWNRWMLRRFLRSFVPPPNEHESSCWVERAMEALQHAPAWYRYSEGIAALIFFAAFVLITIEVTSSSGVWMRLLYVVCWVLLGIRVVMTVRNARHRQRQRTTLPHSS